MFLIFIWVNSTWKNIQYQWHFIFRTQNTNGVGEIRTDISGRPQDRASGTFSLIFKVCTFCSKTKSKKKVILRILELRLFALTLLFVLFFHKYIYWTELKMPLRIGKKLNSSSPTIRCWRRLCYSSLLPSPLWFLSLPTSLPFPPLIQPWLASIDIGTSANMHIVFLCLSLSHYSLVLLIFWISLSISSSYSL